MKRRFSALLVFIVCLLGIFTACLGGCKSNDAVYKVGSFEIKDYSYSKSEQYVTCEAHFKVSVKGDYVFNFTVYGWDGSKRVWKHNQNTTFSSYVSDDYVLTINMHFSADEQATSFTVLDDMSVKRIKTKEEKANENKKSARSSAIALGLFSALLLAGLIELFLLDKKGALNGKK